MILETKVKSVIDLLNDLAYEIQDFRDHCDGYVLIPKDFDKAQQLVGQIRYKLQEKK